MPIGHIEDVIWTPGIRVFYIIHLCVQLGVEFLFLYLNVLLQKNQTRREGWQGFRVPERYDCRTDEHVSQLN